MDALQAFLEQQVDRTFADQRLEPLFTPQPTGEIALVFRRQAAKHHDVAILELQKAIADPNTKFKPEGPRDYVEELVLARRLLAYP